MSLPPTMAQTGAGVKKGMIEESQEIFGHFLLLGLLLTSVYVSRIPTKIVRRFQSNIWQGLGLLLVLVITVVYGSMHGIVAALAYALVVSRAMRGNMEGFSDLEDTYVISDTHRWFGEKLMNENPFIIRDKNVSTSAVQDMSEKSMGSSSSTR
jgi:hypothetical protein